MHVVFHLPGRQSVVRGDRDPSRPVVIDDRVPRYPIDPDLNLVPILQRVDPGVYFEKHVLENVPGVVFVRDTLSDELGQSLIERFVERFD